MSPQVKYNGLIKRNNYENMLNDLLNDNPKINYPNRQATFIRQSPEYQDLLKTDFIELEKQQSQILKERQRQIIINENAMDETSSMKSELVFETPQPSVASDQLQNDLNSVREQRNRASDTGAFISAQIQQMEVDEEAKREQTRELSKTHLKKLKQAQ